MECRREELDEKLLDMVNGGKFTKDATEWLTRNIATTIPQGTNVDVRGIIEVVVNMMEYKKNKVYDLNYLKDTLRQFIPDVDEIK